MARLTGMTEPFSDRVLLLAYVATESASIAMALGALADQNEGSRSGAYRAQEQADQCSWRWAQTLGLVLDDPTDRILACRQFLTENLDALEDMRERLML